MSQRMRPLLEELQDLGGYYSCPKYEYNQRLGPLVGYAGTYEADGQKKQFVGDVYANFAKMERRPDRMMPYVRKLGHKIEEEMNGLYSDWHLDVFCGAPEGGKALAQLLALEAAKLDISDEASYIYPEKEVLELKTATSRGQSKLVWSRHESETDKSVVIVEDVCNNFSTTNDLIKLIEDCGSKVVAITCLLNRSPAVDKEYLYGGRAIPVVSLLRKIILEYKQDDPAVVVDIARGNVVWKPKNEWSRLEAAMAAAVK